MEVKFGTLRLITIRLVSLPLQGGKFNYLITVHIQAVSEFF